MSDFAKIKIGFAVALLAVLFTISPIIKEYGSYGFNIFNVKISVLQLYTAFGVILFVAVYFYSINFITRRGIKYAQQIGDTLYAIAVIIPVLYIILFIGISIVSIIAEYIKLAIIITGLTIGVIVIGLSIVAYLSRQMLTSIRKREKESNIKKYEEDMTHKFNVAQGLLYHGHYNISVISCYEVVEKVITSALYKHDYEYNKLLRRELLNKAFELRLISEKTKSIIDYIASVRNRVLRDKEEITKEEATKVLRETQNILFNEINSDDFINN